MEKLPKRRGTCPFCKAETDFIILQEVEYDGTVDESVLSRKKALEEKNPGSQWRISLPRWNSRALLCPLCGRCNVQEDKSKKGSVDHYMEDKSTSQW